MSEQTKLWNGPSGHAWVDMQEVLDELFRPFERLLVEPVVAGSRERVLDVGCGTGSTTLAAARRIGPAGHCVGIDISEPMLERARTRAWREGARATFVSADAQTHAFEPATFDLMISRFGVMFFDDPVRAFANLRHAASNDALLRFIAWRAPSENPFMTTAERAAAALLPAMPPREPDAPGQFGFADARRVQRILGQSGWTRVDIRPIDVTCAMPSPALDLYVTRLGPVGMALQNADEETRTSVTATVRAAFEPYMDGAQARFTAACWQVDASP